MFPEVHFQRSYVSVGEVRWRNALRTPQMAHLEVWWLDAHPTPHKASSRMRKHATHRRHKRLTLFSRVRTTKGGHSFQYGTIEGGHRTRTRLGLTPQLNWRLPTTKPQKANNATKGQQRHKRPTTPQKATRPQKVNQDHKRSTRPQEVNNPTTQSSRVLRNPRETSSQA